MNTPEDRAHSAAGSALLHHVSPRGGSFGASIDPQRAEQVAQTITGPELLALLVDTATRAMEDAEGARSSDRYRLLDGIRNLAETADSLAVHRFYERESAR